MEIQNEGAFPKLDSPVFQRNCQPKWFTTNEETTASAPILHSQNSIKLIQERKTKIICTLGNYTSTIVNTIFNNIVRN